ncbi:hypothetical protein BGX38DRAFT_1260629 [Terfezia claveryi]|nr:hypothetical protein BGX38DRAFT_1260629 [Terfezia claveryi]
MANKGTLHMSRYVCARDETNNEDAEVTYTYICITQVKLSVLNGIILTTGSFKLAEVTPQNPTSYPFSLSPGRILNVPTRPREVPTRRAMEEYSSPPRVSTEKGEVCSEFNWGLGGRRLVGKGFADGAPVCALLQGGDPHPYMIAGPPIQSQFSTLNLSQSNED